MKITKKSFVSIFHMFVFVDEFQLFVYIFSSLFSVYISVQIAAVCLQFQLFSYILIEMRLFWLIFKKQYGQLLKIEHA